ncbi:PTS sugar transporter subunit IIA [Clostridium paraputrificum]|uniref:PTS sugar transporter subunit IIA n=1 Tax=Clostridium paraputrificum TaxID=29363 RepID=UPI00325BB23D
MYKIIIATHGHLAEAFKSTLKMFTNDIDDVYSVGLTETGVEEFKEKIDNIMKEAYEDGKEILVLADLFGGTPFNTAMLEIKGKYKNVEVIAGINLPLLIEATLLRGGDLKSSMESLKTSAQDAIMIPPSSAVDDDDE